MDLHIIALASLLFATVLSLDISNTDANPLIEPRIEVHYNKDFEPHSYQRTKRKAIYFDTHIQKKWPNEIHYFIEPQNFTDYEKSVIRNVINDDFQSKSCLTFVELDSPSADQEYMRFEKNPISWICKTYIGLHGEEFDGQPLSLGSSCFDRRGYVIHAVASTLGMYSETVRPDRRDYIDIITDNMEPEGMTFFAQESDENVNTHDLPYDYGSVMHLGARAWLKSEYIAQPKRFTVSPKDQRYIRTIGQKSEPSFYDKVILNEAYCEHACDGSPFVECQNGAYQGAGDCGSCLCRDGFSGEQCQDLDQGPSSCTPTSGYISVTEEDPDFSGRACLSSPNFQIAPYSLNDRCTWVLSAPDNKVIEAWFDGVFHLGVDQLGYAPCNHWVEIKDKGMEAVRGPRYCSIVSPSIDSDLEPPTTRNPIKSVGQEMMIVFRAPDFQSHELANYGSNLYGFKLCYRIGDPPPPVMNDTVTPKAAERVAKKSDDNHKQLFLIGIIVAALLLVFIALVILLICCLCRRKKRASPPPTPQPQAQVAFTNAGYAASQHVNVVLSVLEQDVKKHPDELDFSHVGTPPSSPGAWQGFPESPPEYEAFPASRTDNDMETYENAANVEAATRETDTPSAVHNTSALSASK